MTSALEMKAKVHDQRWRLGRLGSAFIGPLSCDQRGERGGGGFLSDTAVYSSFLSFGCLPCRVFVPFFSSAKFIKNNC